MFALVLLIAGMAPGAVATAAGQADPRDDIWRPEPTEAAREALEELDEGRRELGIIAEPAGTIDPCARRDGSRFINFIRRGAHPGDPTYVFGIDLCSRRPFVYREPTRSGVIVGFDADPLDLEWAEDPSDDRNLRGDRFDVELMAGVEVLFGTSTLDYGDTADGTVDVAAAPSLGIRFSRFRLTAARAVVPLERTWLAKLSVMPFRKEPRTEPAPVPPPSTSAEERTTWFDPIEDPCDAQGVGIRGADELHIGHRDADGRYPVRMEMVSYCGRPYRIYQVRTFTEQTYYTP